MSTKDRILDAAVRCFAAGGFAATTTRQLAAEAGVNIATLAYHFGGKEKLYKACIRRQFDNLLSVEAPLAFLQGSAAERIELIVRLVYRFSREKKDQVRLMLRHFVEHGMLPDEVRGGWNHELLARAENLWQVLGLPPDPRWKLKLLTLNHLVTRYAVTEPPDLEAFVDSDDPHYEIENLLVELSQSLLLGTAVAVG